MSVSRLGQASSGDEAASSMLRRRNGLHPQRTSTCSLDQVSMLSDLTFEMCVPIFRWMAAHRMQRNIPRLHDAQAVAAKGKR